MTHFLHRRRFCASLGALGAFGALGANAARAKDARSLDGTWGGAQNGVTAQVIVVGTSVIGFFWRKDYLDAQNAEFSADGRRLSFAFRGGKATLTRTGEETATIDVSEGSSALRLNLKRD